jgi:flagellar M-ring protein FliF
MQINGYSVSVLINSKVMPLTNQLKTAIQSYVTNAVGQRGTTPIPASVSIAAVPFTNQVVVPPAPSFFSTPTGIASIAGGALLLIVLFLLWRRSRNRQKMTDDALGSLTAASSANAPSEAEEVSLTKQLQEMALRRPEAFAGLLRSWISED